MTTTGRTQARLAGLARATLAAALAVGMWAGTPEARAESGEEELRTSAEAWYTTTPVPVPSPGNEACVLAGVCVEDGTVPSPSPYPEHTLHVSIDAGHETARTYVAFDLSSLPEDAVPTGGTVQFPVAEAEAGSVAAEEAQLVACLVRTRIEPVAGAVEEPPATECETAAPLTVSAEGEALVATADLGAFAEAWEGNTTVALAVLPAPAAAEEHASWHIAFHGRERQAEGASPITAVLEYEVPDEEEDEEEAEDEEELEYELVDDGDFDFGVPSAFPGGLDGGDGLPVSDLTDPSTLEPVAADGELRVRRFAYPFVFILPLLLFAGAWYFGGAFTADPLRVRAGTGGASPQRL